MASGPGPQTSTARTSCHPQSEPSLAVPLPEAGRAVRSARQRARQHVCAPFRDAPLTCCYLTVLAGTTLMLRITGTRASSDVLAASSTDVAHLLSRPVRALVTSALWLPDLRWVLWTTLFVLLVIPVERRVGSRWCLAMFASGHVLATLATELPVAWAIDLHLLAAGAAHRLDAGVSYGLFTVVTVLLGMLTATGRRAAAPVLLLAVTIPLLGNPNVTTAGHTVAAFLGICWWPWLARHRYLKILTLRSLLPGHTARQALPAGTTAAVMNPASDPGSRP